MSDRRKIIIVTRSFPPINTTASFRPYGWAKYLKEMGWDPIIVTGNKPKPGQKPNTAYNVNYVDLKPSFFLRMARLPSVRNIRILVYVLEFLHQLFYYYSWYNTMSNYYNVCADLLEHQEDIKHVLITTRPYYLFKVGHALKKKFPRIHWIADYRDDWNTSELFLKNKDAWRFKLFQRIEAPKEKKWVKSAAFFTTVSPFYVQKIKAFMNNEVPGHFIENGYLNEDLKKVKSLGQSIEAKRPFTITYVGSCYNTQDLGLIVEIIASLIKNDKLDVCLQFLGTNLNPFQMNTINGIVSKYDVKPFVHIIGRQPKSESLRVQYNSDALLIVAHTGLKGIPSSKLYEYISMSKPIIVCPSDHDIIEENTLKTGAGIIVNDKEDGVTKIKSLILQIKRDKQPLAINETEVQKFERKNSTEALNQLLRALK